MVAAPFKATLILRGMRSKRTIQKPCTVSDVNAEYYLNASDGQKEIHIPGDDTYALVDLQLSGSGTDTSKATISKDGEDTGKVILNALNVATNQSRQFMAAPIAFLPGSTLLLKQAT
jgi:hypothetical protein